MLQLLIGFGRTVSAWLPPIQSIQSQSISLTLQQTWTWVAKACCGMPGLSCSSTAQWLPQAVSATLAGTNSLLLFSSAHSSPSICRLIQYMTVMKQEGVPMFYDSASSTNLPKFHQCRADNVLGRVPMMPCFVAGNSTPILPHWFGNSEGAAADTSAGRSNGTSSTSGCGGMGGASHGMPLWQKLSRA
jgi:hypothetical protein